MRGTLGGILVQLQSVGCAGEKMPDPQTGDGLSKSSEWVEAEWSKDSQQLSKVTKGAKGHLADSAISEWAGRICPLLDSCLGFSKEASPITIFGQLQEQANKLTEAGRSLAEHKGRFKNLRDEIEGKEEVRYCNQVAVGVLATYLDKLRFNEEDIDALTQRFMDFVREGKRFFDFSFDFQLDDKGNLVLSREGIDGPIQPGGGESQILGLLEMLAVATEFGFPIIIDEVENYLDSANLRKALCFIFDQTDVQMVVTSRDEALSSHLREWGIDHTAYRVTKEADGFTRVNRMQFPG
jgi:hypothetical protein